MPVVTHSFIMSNTRAMLFTTIDGYVSAAWCIFPMYVGYNCM